MAGTGTFVGYSGGYDPLAAHPALDLELITRGTQLTQGTKAFITYEAGTVYFGSEGIYGHYLEAIDCGG